MPNAALLLAVLGTTAKFALASEADYDLYVRDADADLVEAGALFERDPDSIDLDARDLEYDDIFARDLDLSELDARDLEDELFGRDAEAFGGDLDAFDKVSIPSPRTQKEKRNDFYTQYGPSTDFWAAERQIRGSPWYHGSFKGRNSAPRSMAPRRTPSLPPPNPPRYKIERAGPRRVRA